MNGVQYKFRDGLVALVLIYSYMAQFAPECDCVGSIWSRVKCVSRVATRPTAFSPPLLPLPGGSCLKTRVEVVVNVMSVIADISFLMQMDWIS